MDKITAPAGELMGLPPLPEASTYGPSDDYSERTKPYFTAQQMREYAQAALAAKDDNYESAVRGRADMRDALRDARKLLSARAVEIEGLRKDKELRDYLQPADLGDLIRFQETTDDSEGYDIGKPAIRRLAELGVVQSHGFGTYSMTAFGHFAMEHMFKQSPLLPLMTNDDRDRAAIAKEPS